MRKYLYLLILLFALSIVSATNTNIIPQTIIQGTIYEDWQPVEKGVSVSVICGKEFDTETDKHGEYDVKIINEPKDICEIGDKAYIEVEFEGKEYKSDKAEIIEKDKRGFAQIDLNIEKIDPIIINGTVIKKNFILTIIEGQIFRINDSQPVGKDVQIDLYCEHKGDVNFLGSEFTNKNGEYKRYVINLPSKLCVPEDKAWIVTHFQGEEFKSNITVVEPKILGEPKILSESKPKIGYARIDDFVGVPEFSVVGLGLIVIFTGLGLVMIRKT